MADNEQIAKDILEAVGGPSNITNALHCMTRLRLNLKDESVPNDEEVKRIKGVLGSQWSGGQYQVIVGQNVPKVYNALLALGVSAGGEVAENLDPDLPKEELTLRRVGSGIMNYLSKSMVSLIPIMMAAALFRTIAVIAGPGMLGLWAEDSVSYNLFYNWLYDAGFYFMPIYLGWSAAKVLGCSQQLGMMMGGILIAPELIQLVSEAAQMGATTTTIYGIFPALLNNYSTTVLPVLLSVPVLWQVERLFKRVIPDMLAVVFVPFLTMAVMVPLSLCLLAPLGSVLGDGIGTLLFAFGGAGGIVSILACATIAALWEFLVMTGMHVVLITLAMTQLLAVGSDTCVMVAGGIAQWATWGMAFGAFLRLHERDEKGANLGYALSGFVGGVTEPALYGCGFKYTRCLAAMIAGGTAGGLVAGALNVTVYVMGATNFLGLIGFAQGGTGNLVAGIVSSLVAFSVATAVAYLFGFTPKQLEADRTSAEKAKLTA